MSSLSSKTNSGSKIELSIVPGKALGPFNLGTSLWDVLDFLSKKKSYFPTVELKYSEQEPLLYDFIVALPRNALHLRFDGSLQRLKSVECYDPTQIKLVYQNSDVSSRKTIPTFLLVYKSFGPTYSGEFDESQSIYTLKYPGLAFMFPIPARHQEIYKSSTDLPLELPDGTTPIASKVVIYANNGGDDSTRWEQASLPILGPIIAQCNMDKTIKYGKLGRRELESVIGKPIQKEVALNFPMRENDQIDSQVSIQLHRTTAQDLLADLGKPSHIFYKEQDKMKIHSLNDNGKQYQPEILDPNQSTEQDKQLHSPTDYFFNYFYLGLDILIDGGLHICKKVVLHANVPGHYDFGRYKRCPFTLVFPSLEKLPDKEDKDKNSEKKENKSQIKTKENKQDVNPIIEDKSDESQESNDDEKTDMKDDKSDQGLQLETDGSESVVTADMKVDAIQSHIPWKLNRKIQPSPDEALKPVILTRGSSEQNPFGSTYLTGYDQGVVMEVMKNGCVPTIVLY